MKYVKFIKRQDSGWKNSPCYSGETSINLSMEICDFLTFGLVDNGEEISVVFKIHRQDFELALDFIKSQCPVYRTSSQGYTKYSSDSSVFDKLKDELNNYFKGNTTAEYIVTLYNRNDKRIYLKGLNVNGFNIRNYVLEENSALVFSMNDECIDLRIISATYEGDNI